MFGDFIEYLLKNQKRIVLLGKRNNDFLGEKYSGREGVSFFEVPDNYADPLLSRSFIRKSRRLAGLVEREFGQISVITNPFHNTQKCISMFGKNTSLFVAFLHAEEWPLTLINKREKVTTLGSRPEKSRLWYYQRELLNSLSQSKAAWFMNEVTRKYHEYYYDISLSDSYVIPIPFYTEKYKREANMASRQNRDEISIIWLGRFDFFKNPTILRTYQHLLSITENRKTRIKYGLIGYAFDEKFERQIRNELKSTERLKIQLHGRVDPKDINKIVKDYDVGIGMGISTYHLAMNCIPVIVADAADIQSIASIKGCWLHEAPLGFVGGGVYADECGFAIPNRKSIGHLLEEIQDSPEKKRTYGMEAKKYVENNLSISKTMPELVDAWSSSRFSLEHVNIFDIPFRKKISLIAKGVLRRTIGTENIAKIKTFCHLKTEA